MYAEGKEAAEGCNQYDLQQTPSQCITAEDFSTKSKLPGPRPSTLPIQSSKSSLFTIANLLSSARAQRGSKSIDVDSSVVGAIISESSGEFVKTVVTPAQEKIVSTDGDNSVECKQSAKSNELKVAQ